jgi:hypothetical protein
MPGEVKCFVVPGIESIQLYPGEPASGVLALTDGLSDRVWVFYSVDQLADILRPLKWMSDSEKAEHLANARQAAIFSEGSPPPMRISGPEASLLCEGLELYQDVTEMTTEEIPYPFRGAGIITALFPHPGLRGAGIITLHDRGPSVHLFYSQKDGEVLLTAYPRYSHNGGPASSLRSGLVTSGLPATSRRHHRVMTGLAARTIALALLFRKVANSAQVVIIMPHPASGPLAS